MLFFIPHAMTHDSAAAMCHGYCILSVCKLLKIHMCERYVCSGQLHDTQRGRGKLICHKIVKIVAIIIARTFFLASNLILFIRISVAKSSSTGLCTCSCCLRVNKFSFSLLAAPLMKMWLFEVLFWQIYYCCASRVCLRPERISYNTNLHIKVVSRPPRARNIYFNSTINNFRSPAAWVAATFLFFWPHVIISSIFHRLIVATMFDIREIVYKARFSLCLLPHTLCICMLQTLLLYIYALTHIISLPCVYIYLTQYWHNK